MNLSLQHPRPPANQPAREMPFQIRRIHYNNWLYYSRLDHSKLAVADVNDGDDDDSFAWWWDGDTASAG